jgi:hypothetical protein
MDNQAGQTLTEIFISHASEDKEAFVRPLAEALKVSFKVWYDEYQLTIGDSLFTKINVGLSTCDYGVVVLSPSFFAKKWPQAELDGLFALEQKNGKMILPVWKDIDVEGVRASSPILAGRLAALAADGIDRVVDEIRKAVGQTERARELSQIDNITLRLKRLDQNTQSAALADAKLRTVEGANAIRSEKIRVCKLLTDTLEKISAQSQQLKFTFREDHGILQVGAPFHLSMSISLHNISYNYAAEGRLECRIFTFKSAYENNQRGMPPDVLLERDFRPYFGSGGEVIWVSPNSKDTATTTEQMVFTLVEDLTGHLEKAAQG